MAAVLAVGIVSEGTVALACWWHRCPQIVTAVFSCGEERDPLHRFRNALVPSLSASICFPSPSSRSRLATPQPCPGLCLPSS